MFDFFARCTSVVACNFDKSPTLPIILFELFIFAGVAATFLILPKVKDKIGLRFAVMAIAVLIFEVFTAPMWHNFKMGWWAYVYRDVSWILTIGWSAMILSVVLLVDHFLPQWHEGKRFFVYLAILTGLVCILEAIVVNLGIRFYAPEVLRSITGIFVANVPIEVLYYTPVFTALVISFYKYWSFAIDQELLIPVKKEKWLRSLLITFLGVFLFEVMIEPVVRNEGFPQWSYIFHDVSFILTGIWILVVWIATGIVNKFCLHLGMTTRFLLTLLLTAAIALPIESSFIIHGYRVYGESAVANFTGFRTPFTNVPVEVAFAIPCYLALVISFVRYWEILLDNPLPRQVDRPFNNSLEQQV